ncbi:MAG: rhodanese-like domain-containing protein [Treponema sp.]|jgi:rhodanese-related sulfurtransferase|nr:rhodanese-like domain-containing protein [Treponema sp.]
MVNIILITLSCLSVLAGCCKTEPNDTASKAEYRKISAEEAHEMLTTLTDFILLDVRTETEYMGKRIEGAILIPHNEIKSRAEKELPNKKAVILVYCRSGVRSANAAKELVSMGYVNVYDFGGINDWPYDTVNN